jgi:hypothetical protein
MRALSHNVCIGLIVAACAAGPLLSSLPAAAGDSATLVYSGFLGDAMFDVGRAVAVDGSGHAFVAGSTCSSFGPLGPQRKPCRDGCFSGTCDAWVAKVEADGTALDWVFPLAGSLDDMATGVAVDAAGDAYVTGSTSSPDFPVAVGPNLVKGARVDAFVAKIRSDGTGLVYSGFLGGSENEFGTGIAVDGTGEAYVTGFTYSSDFPVLNGPDITYNGGGDGFVTRVKANGTGLRYSGFLGGTASDSGQGVAVDGAGNAYVAGGTTSADYPAVVGPDLTFNGGYEDGVVTKVSHDGRTVVYSGFVGGGSPDTAYGVTVDGAGSAYLTGLTNSPDFPHRRGLDRTYNGAGDAFVTKVRNDGTGFAYSGFLGGMDADYGMAIAVEPSSGAAFVTGRTHSRSFPHRDFPDLSYNGTTDAFVTAVTADGGGVVYSGFLGGSHVDIGEGIAVDDAGNAYVTGSTGSPEFPVLVGPDLTYNDGVDGFVTKVAGTPHAHRTDRWGRGSLRGDG